MHKIDVNTVSANNSIYLKISQHHTSVVDWCYCNTTVLCVIEYLFVFLDEWSCSIGPFSLPNSREYQAAHICFCQVYLFLSRAAVKVISYPVILLTYIPSITLGIICKLSMMCRLVRRMETNLSSFLYFQRITNFPNNTTKSNSS